MEQERRTSDDVHVLACVACPRVSSVTARGWKAFRVEDPDGKGPPELAFYCPDCVQRSFGDDD
jgi:hypothetical protein